MASAVVGRLDAWKSTALLDAAERLIVLALYLGLAARIAAAMDSGGRIVDGLLLVSEGLVIAFMLARRRAAEVSRAPSHWLLALASTCGPLLVSPSPAESWVAPATAGGVWLAGMVVQVSAKLALGRSIGCVPAHRGLKRGGPYRYVRHPMYAGYMLCHAAFLLMNPSLWNLALYGLCDALQFPRMILEERLLGRDPAYRVYRAEVPWRIVPGLF